MSKVSVIIPSYNCARYIREAIDSVLTQTYRDLEIIVVDDGSTDNTKEVLKPYISTNKIYYFYQDNRGLSAARNAGVKLAKGQYLKFLDSDDFLYSEQIEKQMQDIEGQEGAISLSDSLVLKPDGRKAIRNVYLVAKELQFASFVESNRGVVHAFLVPKQLVERVGGFDESLTACEDTDLWIRILQTGAYVKHTAYVGCCYRILNTSMSANTENLFRQKIKIYERVNRLLLDDKVIAPYLMESLTKVNTRLMEECIARHMSLENFFPYTMEMTNKLYNSQKKGLLGLLFKKFGFKNYLQLRYSFKLCTKAGYKFDLLNPNYRWKYL